MPDYRYRALNIHGRIQSGALAANSPLDLQLRLMQAGMTLIESRQTELQGRRIGMQRGSWRDLAQFCQHVAQLDRASVRLTDTLRDVTSSLAPSKLRIQLEQVTLDVESGHRLSQAMAQRPAYFPIPMPALVAAGEASSRLSESFSMLAAHYDWQAKIHSRLKRVLAYPLFALVAMIGVILFLLVYVIPETASFLETMNVQLPAHSRLLIATAQFVVHYGMAIAGIGGGAIAIILVSYKKSPRVTYKIDSLVLKLPLLGSLMQKIDLARFTKILSMLLLSGIDLPPALTTAAQAIKNRYLADMASIITKQVDSGNPLSFAFQVSGIFSPLVYRMVLTGEESGTLPASLQHVAAYYEEDFHNSAESAVNAIGPIITLVTGSLMIWLILSIFMPIYDVLPQLM